MKDKIKLLIERLKFAYAERLSQPRRGRNWLMTIGFFFPFAIFFFVMTAKALWATKLGPFSPDLVDPRDPDGKKLWMTVLLSWAIHTFTGKQAMGNIQYPWDAIGNWLRTSGKMSGFHTITTLSTMAGVSAGTLAGWLLGRGKQVKKHNEGRRYYKHIWPAILATKDAIKVFGKGINIHPMVPIDRDRETRHIMIVGSIGAGKTQVIRNILTSILKRFKDGPEDRIIIYDNKSDVTKGLPVDEKNIILLAPWDNRTWAWDVGKDILNSVDANELCKRLIPKSDDPFWSNAAQQLLVAIFIKMQRERGTNWSWKDINAEISDPYILAEAVKKYNPAMQTLMDDPTSKTAQSVITTLATFTQTIRLLTQAWDNIDPVTGKIYEEGRVIPRFSLREWALTPVVDRRVIIMQGNKRYESLEKAYVQSIISAFGAIMNSPEMTDSKKRRIWFVLDEFPQLGKLENFSPYLEVGRSKGMCVIIGLQDFAQLQEIYKRETANVWGAICGTYIFCRAQGSETIKWIKECIGKREITRFSKSTSKSGDSWSEQTSTEDIVKDEDIYALNVRKRKFAKLPDAPAILNLNNEKGVYQLWWPIVAWADIRESIVPAEWTRHVAAEQVEDISGSITSAWAHVFGEEAEAARKELNVEAKKAVEDAGGTEEKLAIDSKNMADSGLPQSIKDNELLAELIEDPSSGQDDE